MSSEEDLVLCFCFFLDCALFFVRFFFVVGCFFVDHLFVMKVCQVSKDRTWGYYENNLARATNKLIKIWKVIIFDIRILPFLFRELSEAFSNSILVNVGFFCFFRLQIKSRRAHVMRLLNTVSIYEHLSMDIFKRIYM